MKKILQKIGKATLAMILTAVMSLSFAIAVTQAGDTTTTPVAPATPDELFHSFNYQSGASNTPGQSKLGIVSNIAKNTSGDWQTLLAGVIQFILAIAGGLAFASFTYAGVLMVTARGNEEQIKKGKDIILWSIIALAIIATSYALVFGISQLKF